MAVFQFSTLSDGQSLAFNPNADVLNFDQTTIGAADVRVTAVGTSTRLEWAVGFQAGKEVTLTNTSPLQLATTNVTFADGSLLLIGDNSTAQNDNLANSLTGTAGRDLLQGLGGADTMSGGAGNDTYVVGTGDVLVDSGGIDTVVTDINWTLGADFENVEMAGTGNLSVTGNNSANLALGNAGNNYFNMRAGNDTIQAGAGNDWIDMSAFGTASYGDDVIDGGAGIDTVNFAISAGQQSGITVELITGVIRGGGAGGRGSANVSSIEHVIGAGFNDFIGGAAAAETLEGREGNDTLAGMGGNDTLVGGTGQDAFLFAAAPGVGSADLVSDFVSGVDKLTFDNSVFTGVGPTGNFAAGDSRFAAGAGLTSGHDASDRIIYNTTTGQLFYDADGSGAGAAQLVATLQGAPTITVTDIAVVGNDANTNQGTPGDDSVLGTDNNDSLNGLGGNDTIQGFGGDDTLDGGPGLDVLDGGDGNNLIRGGDDGDQLDGGNGNDTLLGEGGNDELRGGAGVNSLDGGAGDDTLFGGAFDSVEGGLGDDTFFVAPGAVVTDAGGTDTVRVHASRSYTLGPGIENLHVFITLGDDNGVRGTLEVGNELNNVIDVFSADGGASVDGREGNDTLIGSAFDRFGDAYLFTVAPGAANADLISHFHPGVDTIALDNTAHANLGATGQFASDDARFFAGAGATSGHDASDRVVYNTSTGQLFYDADGSGAGAAQLIATLEGAPVLNATDIGVIHEPRPGSHLVGTAGNDSLLGGEDNDTIEGLAGNDNIDGGTGDDTLDGGDGDDTLDGSFGSDMLRGGNGNDLLRDVAADTATVTMDGGLGNDTYDLRSGTHPADAVTVIMDAGGVDTILADAAVTLQGGIENLTLFNDAFFGVGNDLDNVIVATGSGFFELFGLAGNDTLVAGDASDSMEGGAGSDLFVVNRIPVFPQAEHIVADFVPGVDRLSLDNRGFDQLGSSGRLAPNDGRFVAGPGAVAHDADDRLIYDTSTGELLYDPDGVGGVEARGIVGFQGRPALSAADITITGDVLAPPIQGTAGNDLLNGTAGRDSINGLAGSDTLNGLGGDDTLDGGAGIDTLNGGLGNDTYVATAGDVLSDTGGVDTVRTDVNWTLGADFENLTMTGTGNISATGHNGSNFLSGNSGNNYFNARAGNDTILGGAGNDWIDMSAFGTASYGDDVIDGGTGIDTVNFAISAGQQSAITMDLNANTIRGGGLDGAGSANVVSIEHVIGTGFGDSMSGSFAADTLEGRDGNDTLAGGESSDTLMGGTGQDSFVFNTAPGATNVDLVTDFVSGTDKLAFDNRVFFKDLGPDGNFAVVDPRFAAGAGFTSGQDQTDRLVYNTTTGQLFYDADGSGAGAAQLIATFQGAPAIAATDIAVV